MRVVDLGIDMGGTCIKLALVEKDGKVVKANTVDADAHLPLGDRLKVLVTEINFLLGQEFRLTGIGIAFPGIIDYHNSRILSKYVKYPDASDLDLQAWAAEQWRVPLVLENDARAALLGEWQYGAGVGSNDLVMFTLGTGVGSAVLLEGRLLRGRNYLAGNLGGHMSIDYNGNRCNCGNIGCVETVGSTWAIPHHVEEFGNSQTSDGTAGAASFKQIFSAAAAGDPVAIKVKNRSLEGWSAGIINFIHAFDPEKIIIGGGIMQSKDEIIPFIQERVHAHSWLGKEGIPILCAKQTKHAGILGMCYLLNNKI